MGEPFWFTLKHLLPDFIHQDAVMNKQWFQALTLDERIALLNIFNSQVSQQQINRKTAQERMQRWRKQNLFMSDADWAQRLELDGVTESEFLNILGTPMEAIGDRVSPPGWMSQIEQVFTEFANSDSHIFLPPEILKESTTGFLYAVEPLIKQGFEQLHQELQQLIQRQSELAFDADTVMEILLANVNKKIVADATQNNGFGNQCGATARIIKWGYATRKISKLHCQFKTAFSSIGFVARISSSHTPNQNLY